MKGGLLTVYALAILAVWVVSFVVGVVIGDYTEFSVATPVVLAIIGGMLAVRPRNGKSGGD